MNELSATGRGTPINQPYELLGKATMDSLQASSA